MSIDLSHSRLFKRYPQIQSEIKIIKFTIAFWPQRNKIEIYSISLFNRALRYQWFAFISLLLLQTRKPNNIVIDQISSNQDGEPHELEPDGSPIHDLPFVVRVGLPGSDGDDDAHDPHQDCPGYIADRPGESVDVFCYGHAGDVEGCNREDPEEAEEQQDAMAESLLEVCQR